jgi:signal transduction histidine kinase
LNVYLAAAVVLMVLQAALITVLLLERARRRRAEAGMLEHQATLEAGNRQISELLGRLIAAQETERSRIARDLHDDVSQRVAALSIAMSNLKQKLSSHTGAADAITALSAMQKDANALANQIRNVSHDLHPNTLQHAGLVSALRGFCGDFGSMHALSVGFSAPADPGPIGGDAALCLYRVTQEALRNVAKHAGARDVTVALSRTGGELHLSIADDGRGFEASGVAGPGKGLGLVSIDERVRLLGGQLFVDTRPGAGTRLSVSIPQ